MRARQAESVTWFEPNNGPANDTEVILYALLLCQAAGSKEELDKWLENVLAQAPPGPEKRRPGHSATSPRPS